MSAQIVKIDGLEFPAGADEIVCNLWMFSLGKKKGDGTFVEPEDRFRYFKAAVDLAFNCEGSICRVLWTPWLELMVREMIGEWEDKRFLGIAGASSSTKSHSVALYGLMEYWARPTETFFIVMSTTKDAARTRIWKSITQLWAQAQKKGCPGKLIDSNGYIKGLNQSMGTDRNSGVLLKPAGSASDGASDELLGIKNPNVIVAADEFNHLTDGILTTAYENMTSNERLMFVGMANPDKLTDPFGELCEPKEGWKSVTENDERWITKYGICIRLNAEKSPRILYPEKFGRVKWLTDQAYCDRIAEKRGGRTSRGYYRFVKAFWCPDGTSNSIYSEVEFLNAGAMEEHEPIWDGPCYTLGSIDPAHSRNGDRSQALIGKLGKVDGRDHLHLCLYQTIEDDVLNKDVPLTHQTVRGWKKLCEDWDVKPTRAIMDNTGAGTPFGHVVDMEWSSAVQKVNFQGKASERTIVFRNEDCSYFNKNSEMWIQPKEFIRSGQITGVNKMLLSELIEREYHDKEGRTVRVESKEEAKKRLKRSPDCFVAGTLISTPNGKVPIELLKEGDSVLTPFGESVITKVHRVDSKSLTTISFNGGSLCGKGSHRVFIYGEGWKRLDQASIGSQIESACTRHQWIILNSLFTRAENTGFKHLADIINPTTGISERDFFIESSGLNTTELFLLIFKSIIKMAIGGIMTSQILRWSNHRIINDFTCSNDLNAQNSGTKTASILGRLRKRPGHGTQPLTVLGGIQKTPNAHGKADLKIKRALVSDAERKSCLSENENTALMNAELFAEMRSQRQKRSPVFVLNAAIRSLFSSIVIRKPVVLSVETKSFGDPVKVYNLTLLEENAYYANGVLVENCADTFNLLVEKAITLGHFKSDEVKKVAKMVDKGWHKFHVKKSLATVCGRKMR